MKPFVRECVAQLVDDCKVKTIYKGYRPLRKTETLLYECVGIYGTNYAIYYDGTKKEITLIDERTPKIIKEIFKGANYE